MFKRTLSMLLALVMVLSVCPVPAMAEEVEETVVETVAETVVETTAEETVPETTVEETVSETTAETTVPETVETIPDETTLETVPEETAPETLPEETLPTETTPEETVEAVLEEEATEEAALEAADSVAIDKTNFPNSVFRTYISSYYDLDEDGFLSPEEITEATSMDLEEYYYDLDWTYREDHIIDNIIGIEYFTSLNYLDCSSLDITSLNVSKNTALTTLDCGYNKLTSLSVSKNTALEVLNCAGNDINKLNISGCTSLAELDCSENALTNLDVSSCISLTDLYCYWNKIASLNISKNVVLTDLSCWRNSLSILDVSQNTALTSLSCPENKLTSLDVSKNIALTTLDCSENELTSLDLSENTALTYLECSYNQLTSLNLSKNVLLTHLNCWDNNLSSLNLSQNTALTELDCGANKLTGLDLSHNTELTVLWCSGNELTELNVSNCTALVELMCSNNNLTKLDTGKCVSLVELWCSQNKLIELNVSKNQELTYLQCSENLLTDLNVCNCTALKSLLCNNNSLTNLNLDSNECLLRLDCYENQLTYLNLSGKNELSYINCSKNKLVELNIDGCHELTMLHCEDNQLTCLNFPNFEDFQFAWMDNQVYTITVDESRTFDLSLLPGDFDISKASRWAGGKVNGTLLTFDEGKEKVTYRYLCGYFDDDDEEDSDNYFYMNVTLSLILKAPEIVFSSNTASGKTIITWEPIGDAISYQVYRSTSKSGSYTRITTTSKTSYQDTSAKAGTTYYYKVRAIAADGTKGDFSSIKSRTCDLAQPVIKLSNVASSGKIKVSWSKVSGAKKYNIYRSTDGESWTLVKTTTSTSYTNTSAKAGNTYYYKVRAIASKSSANSAYSEVLSRVCKLARPSVEISGVSASGKNKLEWKKISGAEEYIIWRSLSEDEGYEEIARVTDVEFIDESAVVGTKYYYKVQAADENPEANSALSYDDSRTCDLARPVVTLRNREKDGKITVSWEAVEGAKEYKVYRATSKSGTYKLMKTTTGTEYTNTSVTAGKTYYYKVKAIHENSAANSSYSSIKSRTADLAQPQVTLTETSSGKPKLTWGKVSGVKSYKVYRSEDGGETWDLMKTTTSRSYTNTSAKAGMTYLYKVRAIHDKSAANSAYSEILGFTVN